MTSEIFVNDTRILVIQKVIHYITPWVQGLHPGGCYNCVSSCQICHMWDTVWVVVQATYVISSHVQNNGFQHTFLNVTFPNTGHYWTKE